MTTSRKLATTSSTTTIERGDELFARAWQRLRDLEEQGTTHYFTLLRLQSDRADTTSDELAEELTARLDPEKPFKAASVRKSLERGRVHFSAFLLNEVETSLEQPTVERLEDELICLGLHTFCQSALERYREIR